ncbi:hypothetical protein ACFVWT_04455 [Arthrobacter sp. NPDC058288]|uniref:hypothetical protein n=1 Tax=Arthrobacter sp. NPDC058288 TaxID=3346424 RepID=UPI0036F07C70
MDVFVCGEALWISCGTWLGFWEGMMGALTSALLAAGVALMVVWLTNRHQTTLVDRQLQDAQTKAEFALGQQKIDQVKAHREQRTALSTQLREQRESLKFQLEEQRKEASKDREHAAIAEVLACLSQAYILLRPTQSLDDLHLVRFAAAMGRWELESTDAELRAELRQWPLQWWDSIRETRKSGGSDEHEVGLVTARVMLNFAREWSNADAVRREVLMKEVREQRERLQKKESETARAV